MFVSWCIYKRRRWGRASNVPTSAERLGLFSIYLVESELASFGRSPAVYVLRPSFIECRNAL
jgi:hypothetical protein